MVQQVHTVQQRIEHKAQSGGFLPAGQIVDPGAETFHQVLRQVAAVQFGKVLGAVLQVIEHLQRGAERIGWGVRRAILAVHIEHVAPNRHRRGAAIVEQLVPAGVAQLGGILAEGDQQVGGMARIDAGFGQAGAQAGSAGGAGVAAAEQHVFHRVQTGDLVVRGQGVAVGDVVGVAGEGVVGMHMGAQIGADQRRADRKVLVAAILARPGFDILGQRSCVVHAPAPW